MPYATNPDDGVRIYYEVDGDGSPILVHHGFTGSGRSFRSYGIGDPLRDDHQLIWADARGHGQSDKPHAADAYGLSQRAVDMVAVLDALDIRQAHFFGYSTGGTVGYGLAKYVPDRFSSFVIGGTLPFPKPPGLFDGMIEWFRTIDELGLAEYEADHRPLPAFQRSIIENNDLKALIADRQASSQFDDLSADLPSVTVPTLLFVGSEDTVQPNLQEETKRAASLMPNGEFLLVEGVDHMGLLGDLDFLMSRVKAFLQRVEADAVE